jgi:hypothetical protein
MTLSDSSDSEGRPLLLIMSDPSHIFFQALAQFRHRIFYANITADRNVPYWTASFSGLDLFRDIDMLDMEYDEDYPSVVKSFKPRTEPPEPVPFGTQVFEKGPIYLTIGLLGPIVVPLWATIALSTMSIQSYQSRHRVLLNFTRQTKLDRILDKAAVVSAADALNAVPEDVSAEGNTLDLLDTQKEVIENLRKLHWTKNIVHCRGKYNAHGAIIVRGHSYDSADGRATVRHCIDGLDL